MSEQVVDQNKGEGTSTRVAIVIVVAGVGVDQKANVDLVWGLSKRCRILVVDSLNGPPSSGRSLSSKYPCCLDRRESRSA